MAEMKDAELHSLLTEAAARERQALKRATVYTAIPVLIGLLLVGFSVYQVVKLNQSKEALTKELNDLKVRRDAATKELEKINAELKERAQQAEQTLAKKSEALAKAEPILQQASEGKAVTKEEAERSLAVIQKASGSRWVVVSGDTALDAAQFEVKRANKNGYPNDSIYLRQNSYRTVIEFPNEATAQEKLPDIRSKLNQGAYLINLEQWCPNAQQRDGYFQCPN